jgi:hypothetical protein
LPTNAFKDAHPISWALATVAEQAGVLIYLGDEQRIQLYKDLGLTSDVIDLIEQPSEENRETLQARINEEWPEDPQVVYLGVVKGVIK